MTAVVGGGPGFFAFSHHPTDVGAAVVGASACAVSVARAARTSRLEGLQKVLSQAEHWNRALDACTRLVVGCAGLGAHVVHYSPLSAILKEETPAPTGRGDLGCSGD